MQDSQTVVIVLLPFIDIVVRTPSKHLPLASPSNAAPDFTATTAASVSARRQHAIVLWKSQEGESRVSISGIEHSLGIQVAMPA